MNKASKARGMRFTHLKLSNWRNFAAVDVALPQRVFLVGPNACGKSNLLDAFRFVRDLASVGGGFQWAVAKRDGVSRLRSLAARSYSDISVRASIGDDDGVAAWEYELTFNQDKQRRTFIKSEKVRKQGELILDRPDAEDNRDAERLTQTYLEQVHANEPVREVAEFFRTVRYLHVVPQLIREPDRFLDKTDDPYGGDFLERVALTTPKTRDARLRRIGRALAFAVPQLSEIELHRDARGTPHLRGRCVHWRPQGAWQAEKDFSDGTLRLMGLLWALQEGTGPLLLEEPELSLHPEVVRHIPQLFARVQRHQGRQVLVSTHSSDMLQDQGLGLDEVLLLLPEKEGTSVNPARSFAEVETLLREGCSLADAVIPTTAPKDAWQLTLFDK
jgi:predicted ATPase